MQRQPPKISNADIEWQDSGAPFSSQFQDIYFSRQGGLAETEHVFIAANQLQERWLFLEQALVSGLADAQTHFTVAELGFGTGLNFLCCWRAWQALAPKHLRLHYIACEKFPLQHAELRRALSQWHELAGWSTQLLKQYPDHSPGCHRLIFRSDSDRADITLDLYYGDAAQTLSAQAAPTEGWVDAWFLDGFAPRTNPDLWNAALFSLLNRLSRPTATLSTYSVAGHVVKTLQEAGFSVAKCAGFGQKRHMLLGRFAHRLQHSNAAPGWLQVRSPRLPPAHVVVIGAGMAGCSTAWSLAQRGCRVTVLESGEDIAGGASGNRQAVLQCRLNNAVNPGWQFNLQAFLHATRHLAWLSEDKPAICWHDCGVLNMDTAFQSRREKCPEVRLDLYAPAVVRRVSKEEASDLAGIALNGGGNFIPSGGWLSPTNLCRAWLQHPLITTQCVVSANRLQCEGSHWQVLDAEGRLVASANAVIIANSTAAVAFEQTQELPLIPLRGQVSYVRASATSSSLQTVVCGRSYISPTMAGEHSTGASYSKDVSDLSLSLQDAQDNIDGIADNLPQGALSHAAVSGGRVSVRAGSGDRMPLVGPAVDVAALQNLYRGLGQRERRFPEETLPCHEGLYVNVGHGSHGLSNTALAAEYLASLLFSEPLPLQKDVLECLHPARFVLRKLRREPAAR